MTTKTDANAGWWSSKLFLVLLAGAAFGSLAIFPYAARITGLDPAALGIPLWLAWLASSLQSTVLASVAILVGMRLGPAVGLGPRLIRKWLELGEEVTPEVNQVMRVAVPLGVAAAVVILALDILVFAQATSDLSQLVTDRPPAWMGLLASFYGGIVEELLMRLGLMTLLVWLVTRLPGAGQGHGWPVWVGILGAALLFGLGHLPATAAMVPLTPMVVLRALLLNGIPGVILGWLYARDGLLAAIVAHFSADIVLHVIFPLLTATA